MQDLCGSPFRKREGVERMLRQQQNNERHAPPWSTTGASNCLAHHTGLEKDPTGTGCLRTSSIDVSAQHDLHLVCPVVHHSAPR